jgi:rod shape-determining protein MreC
VARTRRPRRPRLTIGILILASITIITLDYRGNAQGAISKVKNVASDAFSPIQRGVNDLTRPVGNFLAGAFHGGELENENAKLRAEVGQLERNALANQASQNALKSLEALTHLPWTPGIATVAAMVIAQSSSNFAATVELNVGTRKGVDVGMPVVGGAGLVGQVIEASSRTATVRLITDPNLSVGVRYGSGSNDLAVVNGAGVGKALSVSLVPPGTPLHKGEVLTTSGLTNAAFPPLIPVAEITGFASVASSTQELVTAQPVADLSQLDYVDVLQWPALG